MKKRVILFQLRRGARWQRNASWVFWATFCPQKTITVASYATWWEGHGAWEWIWELWMLGIKYSSSISHRLRNGIGCMTMGHGFSTTMCCYSIDGRKECTPQTSSSTTSICGCNCGASLSISCLKRWCRRLEIGWGIAWKLMNDHGPQTKLILWESEWSSRFRNHWEGEGWWSARKVWERGFITDTNDFQCSVSGVVYWDMMPKFARVLLLRMRAHFSMGHGCVLLEV